MQTSGSKLLKHSYLLMLAPALLLYVVFIVYPFISSIQLSFYNWSGIGPKTWIGLQNYMSIFAQKPFAPMFYQALGHNLVVFGMNVVFALGLGLFFAWLLSLNLKGAGIYKVIYFMPNTLSGAVVAFLWGLLLNPQWGAINVLLKKIGLAVLAQPWLGSPNLALPVIVLIGVWKSLGFPILVLLAAMIGVPKDLVEAAEVDGAGAFTTFWRIMFPLIVPTVLTLSVLEFIGAFGAFELIYVLEGAEAGPFYHTDVFGTLFYRTAFGGMGSTATGMGLGAAMATVMFLIVLPVSLLATWLQRRTSTQL